MASWPPQQQSVGWLLRKAIGVATVTFDISQKKTAEGVDQFETEQRGTGGLKGTTEVTTLDDTPRETEDYVFGRVKSSSRWIQTAEIADEFLKSGWEPAVLEGEVVLTTAECAKVGWKSQTAWGFQVFDGKRYYTRRQVATKGKDRVECVMPYDYKPK
ncbi:MAG: hypothetical protein M1818_007474 [Claussenomyces sp. TS43310]|nr:MAG: hypothetical protein M1818_007474 [Claussenomyces sp. TS43310]